MTETKAQETARHQSEARDQLRTLFPAGSTVSTVVRHVSQSGMERAIVVLSPVRESATEVQNVSWLVARALGWRLHPRHDGVKVKGAGMDMTFHLVYSLASVLYGDGYALTVRNIA
jgi:hypothetical protein